MSCRIISSPTTGKEETSLTWNSIRENVESDEKADELYNQLTSEEFISWFGNWVENPGGEDVSKVVNEIGEPLVVYHGTENVFDTFNKGTYSGYLGRGIYFTPSKKAAQQFSGTTGTYDDMFTKRELADYTKPLFINIKNPIIAKELNDIPTKIVNNDGILFNPKTVIDTERYSEIVAFEPNQVKSIFNSGEFSQEDGNIYHQLSSKMEQADKELDNRLIQYLKPLGITVEQLDNLKERTGTDAIGATDIINKIILVNKNKAALDTLPEETAHFFIELLGNQSDIVRTMLSKIEKWEGYKDVYDEYKDVYKGDVVKIKKEAIGKIIGQYIVSNRKSSFTLLDEIKKFLQEALKMFNIDIISVEEIAEDIAADILSKDYSRLKQTMPSGSRLVNYEDSLNEDPEAKDIVNRMTNLGFYLTGSLALRKQGTVYRTKDDKLHDLDFKVPNNLKQNWRNIIDKEFGGITSETSFSRKSEDIYTIKIKGSNILIDLFINDKPIKDPIKGNISAWQDIFGAKLGMNEGLEGSFGRRKDVRDFLTFSPFEKSKGFDNESSVYLQTENEDLTPSKASPKTIERVKEWLSRIGVDIKALDTARYKGINGVADILNNIIEIAEGKTNEALTEEAMHFAVEIMEITNPALYKKMLNKIGNYQIYKNLSIDETYIKQFTKQGKLDIIGMKKEAIGKVLAETLIRQEQEGIEKPEFLEQSKNWWQQIVEWFKGLVNIAGYNPFEEAIEGLNNIGTVESLKNRQELVKLGKRVEAIQSSETGIFQDEINKALDNKDYRAAISLIANQLTPETFQTVVDRNLNGDAKLGQDIQDFARVYLQTAPENPTADTAMATLKKILADYKVVKHTDTVDPDDESNNSYYTAVIAGKEKKSDRTTEWAKRENLKKTGGKDYMKERAKDPILKMQDTIKALKGTELHAYIEEVFKVFLREDGTIKGEDEVDLSLLPAAKSAELKAVETYLLGDTRKGINGFLFQFEAGTKLFTEQMIFNPNAKNEKGELVGRAGTIDLIAFLPTGKVKVYDWKFMGYTPDKLDQAPQKKSQHALQLADYKRTLKETLGIKDIELQTVPFGVVYKMKTVDGKQIPTVKSVVIGSLDMRQEENTFLLPVVPEDQSTGNKDVDQLVRALKAHYKKLYDKPVGPEGERYIKIQGLNQLSVAIRNLQVALNFKPLEVQAVTFKQNILATIDKYKEIDVATVDKEDINKQINELLDLLKSADTYSNLDKAFISEYGEENLSDDAASTLKNLSAASSAAKNSKKELTDLLKKYVAHAALQQGFSPTEVLSATKEVQGIINSFLEGTKLPNATMNLFAKIVLDARSNDKRLIAAEIKKFGKIYTELQKAYPSDPFKAIGDGHELIRKTKKEFWDALRDAYEDEDANFILANVDEKKLRELVADLIEKRFKQIEETVYSTEDKQNREQKESHRNQVIKDFDIFRGKGFQGFQNRSFQSLVKEAIIEENHYTEEFKKLSGPALDMYNFIFELNRRGFQQGYLGQGHSMRFFPFVLGTTLERLQQSDNILTGAYSSLTDAFTFQKDDTIEYGQIDPETGKLIKTIPKLFTQIGDKEGRENELSTDLLKVIPLFIRALQEYETSKDLEMTFMAMHTVEKAKGHFEVKDNKVIFEGDAPKVFDSNEVNAAALEVMGNDAIYGMRQDTDTLIDMAVSKTTKGTEEEKLRRSMSVKKSIQQTNAYTQGLAVGLKLLVAIPNFVGVFMQSVVNAGLYYTVSDYTRNFKNVVRSTMTGTEGNIMKGLIDLVVPLNEDIVKEGQKKIAWKQSPLKWLSVWSFQDVLMSTNRIGDIAHQLTNAYSFMDNSMVVDGKIVNIRQYIQEKYKGRYKDGSDISQVEKNIEKEVKELKETKSLPKVSFFNKDGILEIPGVTEEEISKYRTKIVEFGRNLTGQMSTENKADYRRNILAQSFMMFKNWIPKQVSLRALDIKKDPVLGQWEYGRTRLFAKTIMHVGFTKINKIKDIINATPEGIAIMQEMLEQKREAYYQKTGLELQITESEFFDMMRKELRAEMKELAILVSVIGLVVAAKVAQPPEEEDDLTKNRYKFWAKAINKISDEMWFYYNPTSAESITRGSVAPSLGLLSKVSKVFYSFGKETAGYVTENEEWQKEAYPQKYFFDIMPFASQFQKEILPIVFPEEAKERGIRTTAEARAMR